MLGHGHGQSAHTRGKKRPLIPLGPRRNDMNVDMDDVRNEFVKHLFGLAKNARKVLLDFFRGFRGDDFGQPIGFTVRRLMA